MQKQVFTPGASFQSDTIYVAERAEYHIYPTDATEVIRPWWTFVYSDDKPLTAAFVLRGLQNVTIDLSGAKLIFHGRIMPFALFDCKNVTLRNFSIDYDRPFFTEGTVLDSHDGEVTIEVPPLYRYRIEGRDLIAVSDTWEHRLTNGDMLFRCFDPETRLPSRHSGVILALIGDNLTPRPTPPLPIHQLFAYDAGERKIRITGLPESFVPRVGEILAMTHEDRRKHGILLERSEDTTIENIRFYHIGAMGVVANLCRNITVRRLDMYIDETCADRVVTVNADSFHTFHCDGKIVVEDCRFENMLDDAINIHGNYLYCLAKTGERELRVESKAQALVQMEYFLPGDAVVIYKGNTQEVRTRGVVESAEYEGDSDYMRVRFTEKNGEIEDGDMLESERMPEIEVCRCHSRCMGGFRISSSRRVVIEDCTFETAAFSVAFTGDMNYWFENGPVKDVTIRRCTFTNCAIPVTTGCGFRPTTAAPFYHENLRFTENAIHLAGNAILNLSDMRGITYENNTVTGVQDGQMPIRLNRCSDVTIR